MALKIFKVTARRRTYERGRRSYRAGHTRLYFFPQGESVMDNLRNRRTRPHNVYRTFIPAALDLLRAKSNTEADYKMVEAWMKPEKISWSQRAGCSCPCSPGFIVIGPGFKDFDIYVDIADENYVEPVKELTCVAEGI